MSTGSRWMLLAMSIWLASCTGSQSQPRAQQDAINRSQCPDLSGNYLTQGEDGQVRISIEQAGCERITILRRSNYLATFTAEKHELALDGEMRDDSPWFNSSEQSTTAARFDGSALKLEVRTSGGHTNTIVYSLTPDRDLLEDVLLDGRRLGDGPSVAARDAK